MIGYCESACGIGLMLGPVIGALLYSALKYEWTFFAFTVIMAFGCLTILILLPKNAGKGKERPLTPEVLLYDDLHYEEQKKGEGSRDEDD